MKQVNLLSAELACILSLLQWRKPLGVDGRQLPTDEDSRGELNKTGFEALKRRQWIAPDAETGRLSLSPELLEIVAAMVFPQVAIVTDIAENNSKLRKRIVHYIANEIIVEQTFIGDEGYRLSSFSELPEVLLRIVQMVGIPDEISTGDHGLEIDASQFTKIKEWVDGGAPQQALAALEALNAERAAADSAILAMAKPDLSGTTQLLKLQGDSIQDANGLGFFVTEASCWLAIKSKSADANVVLRTANEFEVWMMLQGLLGELVA